MGTSAGSSTEPHISGCPFAFTLLLGVFRVASRTIGPTTGTRPCTRRDMRETALSLNTRVARVLGRHPATTTRTLSPLFLGEWVTTLGAGSRISKTTKLTITKSNGETAAFHEEAGKLPGVNPSLVGGVARCRSVDVVSWAAYVVEW